MITAYYKLELLSDEVRTLNGIRSKKRLDCTKYFDTTSKGYNGLNMFKNGKGHLVFYKTPNRNFLSSSSRRTSEYSLTNNEMNFSSIYIEDEEFPEYGYGYPNANKELKHGKKNPVYQFRLDAYLFIVNEDYSRVEILVISEGRNLISSYYQKLIDGDFDEAINQLREQAKPYFNYKRAA